MSHYQLIAFDMDGTLLDSSKRILPSSLRAIDRAVKADKAVVVSTGRNPREIDVFDDQLSSVRYRISCSGALVYDRQENQSIFAVPIPDETVQEIFRRFHDLDVCIHILSYESVFQKDKLDNIQEYHMEAYGPLFHQICVLTDNIEQKWHAEHFPAFKLNIYSRTPEAREKHLVLLKDLPVQCVYSESTALELSAAGISKAAGLEALCQHLKIPIEDTIAVGDADNDMVILSAAGMGIAMGNAIPRVLSAADAVVADNDHDGCAEAIDRWLLK